MSKTSSALLSVILVSALPALAAGPSLPPNPYFKTAAELERAVVRGSSVATTLDDIEVEPRAGGVFRIQLEGSVVTREGAGDPGQYQEEVRSAIIDYSTAEGRVVGGTGRVAGVPFCDGYAEPGGVPSCYAAPPAAEREKAALVARHLLERRVPRMLTEEHAAALTMFRSGRKPEAAQRAAALLAAAPWKVVPITAANVDAYNDLGFFLVEGGKASEAAPVLEEVVRAVPGRAVAYLNLGDAYAGVQDAARARPAYARYRELMEAAGNGKKVPERVRSFLAK